MDGQREGNTTHNTRPGGNVKVAVPLQTECVPWAAQSGKITTMQGEPTPGTLDPHRCGPWVEVGPPYIYSGASTLSARQ